MKVKDLIDHLKACSQESEVFVEVDKIQSSPKDHDINISASLEDIVTSFKNGCVFLKGTLTKKGNL